MTYTVDEYYCGLRFHENPQRSGQGQWEIYKYMLSGDIWQRLPKFGQAAGAGWERTVDVEVYSILDCGRCKHKMVCLLNPIVELTYEKPLQSEET